jgi:hypothetical protein
MFSCQIAGLAGHYEQEGSVVVEHGSFLACISNPGEHAVDDICRVLVMGSPSQRLGALGVGSSASAVA